MEQAVMVTTEWRGIFFGYVPETEDLTSKIITLKRARNCIYWESGIRGFIGLASDGPSEKCKIGPQASEIVLQGITSVTKVENKSAIEKWESAPWNG